MSNLKFVPDKEMLETLMSIGIDRRKAEIALYNTANTSLDAATAYVFDNPDNLVDTRTLSTQHKLKETRSKNKKKPKPETPDSDEDSESGEGSEENCSEEDAEIYKMVFLVNSALNMRPGKIAAQVGHATLGLYRNLLHLDNLFDAVDSWEENGEKKIVLKAKNHIQLLETQDHLNVMEIQTYLVHDAGHTQVPEGSMTVLAIFGLEEMIDSITGDFKLL